MILIVGGLGAGKRTSPGVSWGSGRRSCPRSWGLGHQVLYDLHALDPLPDLEELMGLRAVICNEVGCGLVPIQAEERQRRRRWAASAASWRRGPRRCTGSPAGWL